MCNWLVETLIDIFQLWVWSGSHWEFFMDAAKVSDWSIIDTKLLFAIWDADYLQTWKWSVFVQMCFYPERLACVYRHRDYLSSRALSVRFLFGCNVEHNVPQLLGEIVNETGVKPIYQSIYRTICWSIYRHKLMVGIIMVRYITIYEVPLERLSFWRYMGTVWSLNHGMFLWLDRKVSNPSVPSNMPLRVVMMLCSESYCSILSGLLIMKNVRNILKQKSRLILLAVWRMSIFIVNGVWMHFIKNLCCYETNILDHCIFYSRM